MLKDNLHYFKHSIKNIESTFDKAYMFLDWNVDIEKYVKTTKQMKELLATIKTLNAKKTNADEIYIDLFKLWQSTFAGESELNCFILACDSSRDGIMNNFENFKHIVNLYLEYRDFTEITPKEWIQALLDSASSKKKR